MQQDLVKIDQHHDKRILTMGSTDEANTYRRCFIDTSETRTHRLMAKWIDPLHVEIAPEQFPLSDIAARTNGFLDLTIPELRALAAANGVEDVTGQTNSVLTGDKEALAANLMKKATEAPVEPPVQSPCTMRPGPITLAQIPAEIRGMTDADLETRAVELGIKRGNWSKLSRPKRERAIVDHTPIPA